MSKFRFKFEIGERIYFFTPGLSTEEIHDWLHCPHISIEDRANLEKRYLVKVIESADHDDEYVHIGLLNCDCSFFAASEALHKITPLEELALVLD